MNGQIGGEKLIKIINPDLALEQTSELAKSYSDAWYAYGELLNCYNKMNQAWISDGTDRETYMTSFNKCLSDLRWLTNAAFQIAMIVQDYAEEEKRVQSTI